MSDSMQAEVVLQGIADDVKTITKQIENARVLVQAAKDAGVSVSQQEADIRSLEIQKEKWQKMLDVRGIKAK